LKELNNFIKDPLSFSPKGEMEKQTPSPVGEGGEGGGICKLKINLIWRGIKQ
jgi:hypothetical protein